GGGGARAGGGRPAAGEWPGTPSGPASNSTGSSRRPPTPDPQSGEGASRPPIRPQWPRGPDAQPLEGSRVASRRTPHGHTAKPSWAVCREPPPGRIPVLPSVGAPTPQTDAPGEEHSDPDGGVLPANRPGRGLNSRSWRGRSAAAPPRHRPE